MTTYTNTYTVSSTEDHEYLITNNDGVYALGTASNLVDDETRQITVNLNSYKTITLSTGVSDLSSVQFKLAGRLVNATNAGSGNYTVKIADGTASSAIEIPYYIIDDNYAPYYSSLTFSGSNTTESITLTDCTKSTFTRPNLTANGILGGSSFAVSAVSYNESNYPAWKAMDSSTSTYWQSENLNEGSISPTPKYADYIIYNPNFFLVGSFTLTSSSSSYCPYDIYVYTSADGTNWDLDQTVLANTSASKTITMNTTIPYKYIKLSMNQRYYYNYYVYLTNITFSNTYEWIVSDTYTLTVNTTPSDAVVLFSSSNASGKTTQISYAGSVQYTVAKTGYKPVSGVASTINTDKTINASLTEQATPDMTWYAWKNGSNIVYTQTETPQADVDWTFSAPNTIADVISAVNTDTLTSNNITYTKTPSSNIEDYLSTQTFTIQTDIYTANNTEFYLPIETKTPYALNVDWGDGNTELIQGVGTYPHHTYSTKGTYQISIKSELCKMPRLTGALSGDSTHKYPNRQIKSMNSCMLPIYQNYLEDFNYLNADTNYYTTYYASNIERTCSNFVEKSNLENYKCLFYQNANLLNLPEVGLNKDSNLSTPYKYQSTFYGCKKITSPINMADVREISGTYALSEAFYGCTGLTSIDLSNLTTVSGNYSMSNAFQGCTGLTSIDLSSLTTISGTNGIYYTFYGCNKLTSVDLSALTTISGSSGMAQAFQNCTSLTSVDLSSLTTVSGSNGMSSAFQGCTSLASIDLSSLTTVSGSNGMYRTFFSCTSLTSVDLSSLTTISGSSGMAQAFYNCTSLTSVDLSNLATISSQGIYNAFYGCTSLRTLSFPSLNPNSFGSSTNQFNSMLQGCSNVTVHFPIIIKETIQDWDSVQAGFGGTNTTVLFDIGGCEVTFNCTPSTNNQIWVKDRVIPGNISWETKNTTVPYQVFNTANYQLYVGTANIPDSASTTVNVDTTTATSEIKINAGISGLTVTYSILGQSLTALDNNDGTYSIRINAPSGTSINYSVLGGDNYTDATGTLTYTGSSITENVTLSPASISTFTQPVLTANGTIGEYSFAVNSNLATTNTWKLFDGSTANLTYYTSAPVNMKIIIYNPDPIKLSSYQTYWYQSSVAYQAHTGQIYGSHDGVNWIKINEFTRSNYTQQTTVTTVNSPSFYKYYRIEEQPSGSWWWGANEITLTATVKTPSN